MEVSFIQHMKIAGFRHVIHRRILFRERRSGKVRGALQDLCKISSFVDTCYSAMRAKYVDGCSVI
jgi:hypothetical protein